MRKDLSEPLHWRWVPKHSSHSSRRGQTIGHVPASGRSENHELLNPATVDAVHELDSQSMALATNHGRPGHGQMSPAKGPAQSPQKDGMTDRKASQSSGHERLDLVGSLTTQLVFLEAQHRQLSQLLDEAMRNQQVLA